MGRPIAAIGDFTTGHQSWPSTNICQGANTIIVSGKCPARVGDAAIPHTSTDDPFPTHGSIIAQGSGSVIYQGRMAARIGDSLSCSDIIAVGQNTIIIGD